VLLETVFSTWSVQKGYNGENLSKKRELGATVQREAEPGRRETVIVRSHYQATTSDDIAGWETVCALVIC
jgi:hypothetical protein